MLTDSIAPPEVLDELSRRAHDLYIDQLQAVLEPEHNGEFVAIHVDSADYDVGRSSSRARFALRARHPDGMIVTTKIGPATDDPLAYRMLASQFAAERGVPLWGSVPVHAD